MRLRRQGETWTPFFTVLWKVELLAEAPAQSWIPFTRSRLSQTPLGEIQAQTHQIRFFETPPQEHTLVVSLLPPDQPPYPTYTPHVTYGTRESRAFIQKRLHPSQTQKHPTCSSNIQYGLCCKKEHESEMDARYLSHLV